MLFSAQADQGTCSLRVDRQTRPEKFVSFVWWLILVTLALSMSIKNIGSHLKIWPWRTWSMPNPKSPLHYQKIITISITLPKICQIFWDFRKFDLGMTFKDQLSQQPDLDHGLQGQLKVKIVFLNDTLRFLSWKDRKQIKVVKSSDLSI